MRGFCKVWGYSIGIIFPYSLVITIENPRCSLGRLGKIRCCKKMHVVEMEETSDNACALGVMNVLEDYTSSPALALVVTAPL